MHSICCSDNDSHMQRTLTATEQWMYSGPFKFNFYASIVDGTTAVLSGVCTTTSRFKDKRSTHAVNQSFIDLLISLAGPCVLKYIGDVSNIPEDPVKRVNYVLKLYTNVLDFLAVQGALLAHVNPKFLLSFNDYLLYDNWSERNSAGAEPPSEMANTLQREKIPRELFQSRSMQCWLDVALQTFKILVLKRISVRDSEGKTVSPQNRSNSGTVTLEANTVSVLEYPINKTSFTGESKDTSRYTVEEIILLNWLQHHFNQQRSEEWMKDDKANMNPRQRMDVLQPRTISNFESDLSDSLVLIAVTAAYCPYLIRDHFKNIYIAPQNMEEIFHNGICLTAAWRRVRIGFMITAAQIVNPNCVQMVMLVTHLYSILPTLRPSKQLQFCCPLTETITRQITIQNASDFPVSYIVEFIGNEMNFFTALVQKSIVSINNHASGKLRIRYHARKIIETRAFLILCGSSVAPHFAQNHVFELEGCTSYLGITNNYDIEGILYKVCEETLNISVPFKEAAEYNISFSEEQPTVPASLKLSGWADLRNRKVPRRLFLNQKTIIAKENAFQAHLSMTVACIAPTKRSFWIVFESGIGDFIIQINSTSKKSTTDYVAVEWEREICVCTNLPQESSSSCPLNIEVAIPVRNVQLWKCIIEMFQKTLDSKECLFWSHHLDTDIGLRLIHWLMGDYNDSAAKEFMHIFNTSVVYDVTTTDDGNLIVPKKLAVQDVRPRGTEINMSVHISETTPQFYETSIRLSSPDGMEHRSYKIDFLCKTPLPASIDLKTSNYRNRREK
ncbi:cilia- and flagella-associated protein 47-like [Neodiprion lecontei]|uniref:Cilia- and flagella-associated protein 47-like n=1 Tax=Neodiprion lecontei TaxID=441921 RepID=A0A6J0BGQ9_NEOLC|nr:cilia- and flagella-associated protein 47-like [Neodiprion lecontei]